MVWARWKAVNRYLPLLLATCGLAACSGPGPVAKNARNTIAIATTTKPSPSSDASGGPPAHQAQPDQAPPMAAAALASALPLSLQGRWALAPMDCTARPGTAKGLLVIGPDELRFFESRALPTADVQLEPDGAAGTFRFASGHREWTRYEAMQVRQHLLTRTESNPTASFTYVKCS